MKKIILVLIVFLSSCSTITTGPYSVNPYDRYYLYRKSILSLNRYNYLYPYYYYQPRIYVQPRPQQPRVYDLNSQKSQNKKSNTPVRKFK